MFPVADIEPVSEQCFTSPPTQYRLYGETVFTGQKTQPTVSKYRRKISNQSSQNVTSKTERSGHLSQTNTALSSNNSVKAPNSTAVPNDPFNLNNTANIFVTKYMHNYKQLQQVLIHVTEHQIWISSYVKMNVIFLTAINNIL